MELLDIMNDPLAINIMGKEVVLDPARQHFEEATIPTYMQEEAGWIEYFGRQLAEAEYERQGAELQVEILFAKNFTINKEGGCSDKLAEQKAKADPDYEAAKIRAIACRRKERLIQQHLKSWAMSHENAQNRGHSLRRELQVMGTNANYKPPELTEEDKRLIADIIGEQTEEKDDSSGD